MIRRKRALIVFAKIPEANRVKTRLTGLLDPDEAAELYDAFLKDALDVYLGLEVDVRLYFSPSDADVPVSLQPSGASVHAQQGTGLGPRMAAAFAETFVAGYREIVIVGTDHPTLPAEFITKAFDVLSDPGSIAIGPSEDGGYYLLGMNDFYPGLFEDMAYSHDRVFEETLLRAGETPASIYVLPIWYDVDDPEGLLRLAGDLNDSTMALPRTRAVVARLERSHPELKHLTP